MTRILLYALFAVVFSACQSPAQKQETDNPSTDDAPQKEVQVDVNIVNPEDIPEPKGMDEEPPPPPYAPVFSKEELLGRISPSKHEGFSKIASQYTSKSNIYMRTEAYEAFKEMHAAAKADGLTLTIVSATRTFGAQKGIWERKWTGVTRVGGKNLATSTPDHAERAKAILTYSSMPGTSRHHWGTDIDLNNLNNSWFESGTGKKIYDWLVKHAGDYGFCQVYSPIDEYRPHGYLEEKWHWSFMPLAKQFLADYEGSIEHEHIEGFKGSEVAEELNIIEHFVGGINPDCRE